MSKRPIIIDTDPGIDDALAIAIALFSEELEVKLITTVAGNVSLEKVTNNALRLLAFFEKDIPVAAGASAPLIEELIDASNVHGVSGMEGFDFPEPKKSLLLKENAVNAMYRTIMESEEKVTLVPIAPLTNIALLFAMYPEVKERIQEIVMMGGSASRGNKGTTSNICGHKRYAIAQLSYIFNPVLKLPPRYFLNRQCAIFPTSPSSKSFAVSSGKTKAFQPTSNPAITNGTPEANTIFAASGSVATLNSDALTQD